ncbi:TIGR01777 family oxidoreductase [Mycolicibacterium bacteremicum]|uniref:TIGR01777 family protein n=1 Tax=Mycolicibacterium bacteremicum TaxID=564198 RepID=A0A1W9Z2H3_MYCBA|nr:TIGR01777 family oxidoreductase [Mycolicibacterium bacteremicum]MCV7433080.1 TIGR01777 family protein [Mycolicibacterium bacteremicum]ORA06240.1 TIGR01777 family protein [Mycolicibacterium bacteremicum]
MTEQVIAVAGSSGLIGSALTTTLRAAEHRVLRLVRRAPSGADEVFWDPDSGRLDIDALTGVDAVINLCGVGVADQRWSGAFKQSLRDSRIGPTEVLAAAVAEVGIPLLINASAVGFYGDTRNRMVDETAPRGDGFLAQLCADWEASTAAASDAGARVVLLRTGLVLSPSGGMLSRLRPIFGLGLGARLGNGRQYFPWISLEDVIRAIRFALRHDALSGPVNLTGPAPVTNGEFTAAFGRALHRPTPMIVPGFALRAALGEFADEGLLAGQRAIPAALERAGFVFAHNTVGEALTYVTSGVPPA